MIEREGEEDRSMLVVRLGQGDVRVCLELVLGPVAFHCILERGSLLYALKGVGKRAPENRELKDERLGVSA